MRDILAETKYLCRKYNLSPSRSKGQNFLIDESVLEEIILTAELKSEDLILEIGSGLGILTGELIKKVKKVIAIESDERLFEILKKIQQASTKLILKHQDILKADKNKLMTELGAKLVDKEIYNYKIVANIPYNISSLLLRSFLNEAPKPKKLVLLLQKELAERLTAPPGKMSLLSIAGQFYADVKIVKEVPAESFWPQPEVDSAIVRLKTFDPGKKYDLPAGFSEKKFWRLVKVGFSARRKMLKNNLQNGFEASDQWATDCLEAAGLKKEARAQQLSIPDWLKLYKRV